MQGLPHSWRNLRLYKDCPWTVTQSFLTKLRGLRIYGRNKRLEETA
jgi:hypothetical protein